MISPRGPNSAASCARAAGSGNKNKNTMASVPANVSEASLMVRVLNLARKAPVANRIAENRPRRESFSRKAQAPLRLNELGRAEFSGSETIEA